MQKHSMLSQLHINGISYLLSALLLLVGIPLYQLLVLNPAGYGTLLADNNGKSLATAYLHWIGAHQLQFIIHRLLLTLTFVLLLTLPFVLFRIIIAQELVAQVEQAEEEGDEETEDDLPAHPWRGKGFVIIAVWAGLSGLLLYILGTIGGTIYLVSASNSATMPANFTLTSSLFSLVPNSIGIGLLALSCLFFGAMIARRGRYIWPGIWVAFGYAALAVAALFSGSAVGVASSPATGQATLTTPAMLLFALWVLWFGIMLVRLRPE